MLLRPHGDRQAEPAPAAATGLAESDEARLIARVVDGELRAFEALYRSYHPRLSRFLDRMTRRPALVDEVLNDTLLVVWHRAASYNGRSKVSTWIFGIAYRKALKALRQFDEPAAAPEQTDDDRIDPGAGPEQRAGQRELRAALLDALDALSPEQRAVVELCYFQGLGCREIAEIAQCPVDTVKTRMFHARRRLRVLLPGRHEDWP